ncbi:MAG TPA: hypothetical protein VGS21_12055, partial [Acidimicrobiales bacterium]|nr:hypothetical protein [Acidimicrobiales bacterium]
MLIGIVAVPISQVYYEAVSSASANANRQDATALGTGIISHLSSTAYGSVGFTQAQLHAAATALPAYATENTGPPDTFSWSPGGVGGDSGTETLVQVSTAPSFNAPGTTTAFAPIMTNVRFRGGTFISVIVHIISQSAKIPACSSNPGGNPTTTIAGATERAFVVVNWLQGATSESIEQDSVIYPGGLQPYRGPDYNASNTPPVPTNLSVTPGPFTGSLVVSWGLPASWQPPSGGCFSIGYADQTRSVFSTGMINNNSGALTTSGLGTS